MMRFCFFYNRGGSTARTPNRSLHCLVKAHLGSINQLTILKGFICRGSYHNSELKEKIFQGVWTNMSYALRNEIPRLLDLHIFLVLLLEINISNSNTLFKAASNHRLKDGFPKRKYLSKIPE
jgi:hypothetical protein